MPDDWLVEDSEKGIDDDGHFTQGDSTTRGGPSREIDSKEEFDEYDENESNGERKVNEPDIDGKPEKDKDIYVNLAFTDASRDYIPKPWPKLELNQGFRPNGIYQLEVLLSHQPDVRYRDESNQSTVVIPEEVQELEFFDLYVASFSSTETLEIASPLSTLRCTPYGKTSQSATFTLRVAPIEEKKVAKLNLYIYYKTNLIYTSAISIEIQPEEHPWSDHGRPIEWVYQKDLDKKPI